MKYKNFLGLILFILLIIVPFEVKASTYNPDEYDVIDVAGQSNYFYYINKNNELYSAGSNGNGVIGIGTITNDTYINPKKIFDNVLSVYTGKGKSSYLITTNNDIYSWGNNKFGQLCLGTEYNSDNETNSVSVISKINVPTTAKPLKIACGAYHVIVLFDDGSVYSCGSNNAGQLGIDLKISNKSCVGVLTKINQSYFNNELIVDIASCEYTSYCLTEQGNVYSFGENSSGLLATSDADTTINSAIPVKTVLENIKEISANSTTALALTSDLKVYSWGSNIFGQLGVASFNAKFSETPIEVTEFFDIQGNKENITVKQIICGGITNFILSTDGDVFAFGSGSNGQCGFDVNDTSLQSNPNISLSNVINPTKITFYQGLSIYNINQDSSNIYYGKLAVDITNEVEVNIEKLVFSAGSRTFMIDDKGDMWGIGDNTSGLLGTGDVNEAKVPIVVTLYRIQNYDKEVETKDYLRRPIIILIIVFVFFVTFLIIQDVKQRRLKKLSKEVPEDIELKL